MNNAEMIKKLEDIDKQVKYLINQLKNDSQEQMSPTQKAVKTITCSKSNNEQVKQGLDVLCNTPDSLSAKQVAFVLYFAFLNKNQLGDDIDNYLKIEIGKRKYSERNNFIEQVQDILDKNYNNNRQFKNKLINYLDGFKK